MITTSFIMGFLSAALIVAPNVDHSNWMAELDGTQVVPPNSSQGTAAVFIDYNIDEIYEPHPFTFDVIFEGLSTPTTGAYVRMGQTGLNGPTVITLLEEEFASPAYGYGEASFSDILQRLDSGFYVVITTVSYPDGEIRGEFMNITPPAVQESSWGAIRALYR
jgi:hypothetical protein